MGWLQVLRRWWQKRGRSPEGFVHAVGAAEVRHEATTDSLPLDSAAWPAEITGYFSHWRLTGESGFVAAEPLRIEWRECTVRHGNPRETEWFCRLTLGARPVLFRYVVNYMSVGNRGTHQYRALARNVEWIPCPFLRKRGEAGHPITFRKLSDGRLQLQFEDKGRGAVHNTSVSYEKRFRITVSASGTHGWATLRDYSDTSS